MEALEKTLDSPASKYLVFTSAGDRSNLKCWLKGRRNFDFWVTYYGETKNRYRDAADYYLARKGGKFPNLYYAYRDFQNIFQRYTAILVMDDDLIISGTGISRLFEIREKYDLWLLQPAYDPRGKISHPITLARPLSFLRYTNFVETGGALFKREFLDEFMSVFDPVLVGWGIDWWYMNVLGERVEKRVAVVDAVTCVNPTDEMKGGKREIELLQDTPTRIKNWKTIQRRYDLREILAADQREYGSEKFPLKADYLASSLEYWTRITVRKLAAKLNAGIARLKLNSTNR